MGGLEGPDCCAVQEDLSKIDHAAPHEAVPGQKPTFQQTTISNLGVA